MIANRICKSGLRTSAATFALVSGAILGAEQASAQAINATPTVTQGSASVDSTVPDLTTVTVDTMDTVIDWTPDEDVAGNALTFLPSTGTAIFQNSTAVTDFGVLNRILPATNGNVAVIDGTVISRIQDALGAFAPGGNVAFYSPTGLLIGANATFDVGRLILTTLDPDPTELGAFWAGGSFLNFNGNTGATQSIQIDNGALIQAGEEGSYVAMVAPAIDMAGTVDVNGSVVYASAEQARLRYNAGLFDIIVATPSAVGGTVISHSGTTTGPSSTSATDRHMIYGVAQAGANPINMLFSGNLGFAPAAVAGVVNGDIVLSANYDVLGLLVAEGFVGGSNFFLGRNARSTTQADIVVQDPAIISSNLTAVSTHTAAVRAATGDIDITGNVFLTGKELSEMRATMGSDITVTGNVVASTINAPFFISGTFDIVGGTAIVAADQNGTITISGSATVGADVFASYDFINQRIGAATGGTAQVSANSSGTVDIGGNLLLQSRPQTNGNNVATSIGDQAGGLVQVDVGTGGTVRVVGDTFAVAEGSSNNITNAAAGDGGNGNGGTARIVTTGGGGLIDLQGRLSLSAEGRGGQTGGPSTGGTGTGGIVEVIASDNGSIGVVSSTTINVNGFGVFTSGAGSTGGSGQGGTVTVRAETGGQVATASLRADAQGFGRNGFLANGNGTGGAIRIEAASGILDLSSLIADVSGQGGQLFGVGASTLDGGIGSGGTIDVLVEGTMTNPSTLDAALTLQAIGRGGRGSNGDGATILPGAGGAATGGNIRVFVDARYGDLQANNINARTDGLGGLGGAGGTGQDGGDGGDGAGGDVSIGIDVASAPVAPLLGGLTVTGSISAESSGSGGSGGSGGTGVFGNGGNGQGGNAEIFAGAGTLTAGGAFLTAGGGGADGQLSGSGTGGEAQLLAYADGTINISGQANIRSDGSSAQGVNGGSGQGGQARIEVAEGSITIGGNVDVTANGSGGNAALGIGGLGGDGTGGLAVINAQGDLTNSAAITINGFVDVEARGQGGTGGDGDGAAIAAGNGGVGIGGQDIDGNGAFVLAGGDNGVISITNPLDILADGTGGQGGNGGTGQNGADGGDGIGGTAVAGVDQGNGDGSVGNGSLTATGILVSAIGTGGDGGTGTLAGLGGLGTGGRSLLRTQFGSASLSNAVIDASAFGGQGSDGGNANGGFASVEITDNGELAAGSAGNFSIRAEGTGGGGAQGAGGTATGGTANATVDTGTLNSTNLSVGAGAFGGSGTGDTALGIAGVGGSASAGNASLAVGNGTFNALAASGTSILSNADAGVGTDTSGNAQAGTSSLRGNAGGVINLAGLTISADAATADMVGTGSLTGGLAEIFLDGATASATGNVNLFAEANGASVTATAGDVAITLENQSGSPAALTPMLDFGFTMLSADATGAAAGANAAGTFGVFANTGSATFDTLLAFGRGDFSRNTVTQGILAAMGGDIIIATDAQLTGVGNLEVTATSGGSVIGGNDPTNLTADVALTTDGTIRIIGDDATRRSFSANNIQLTSSDIDIDPGARFGGGTIALTSNGLAGRAIIGGSAAEPGYRLTDAEGAAFETDRIDFFAPAIGTDPARDADVEIRAVNILGSENGGNPLQITLTSGGTMSIVGQINFDDAVPADILRLFANERLAVVTDAGGGVAMTNSAGDLSGQLFLGSANIFAADQALINQLIADPSFAGFESALETNNGADSPDGVIRADSIGISASETLRVQNTGTATQFAGITVGSSGLAITPEPNQSGNLELSVVAFGSQLLPNGDRVINSDFFQTIDFGTSPAAEYVAIETFNNCVISTGECPAVAVNPPVPNQGLTDSTPPVTNPTVVNTPVDPPNILSPEPTEDQGDPEFGVDFPVLVSAPLISDEQDIDDPVTTGSDGALFAISLGEEDEEDDDANAASSREEAE